MGPTGDLIVPQKDDGPQKRKYEQDAEELDKSARKYGWGAIGVLLVSSVVLIKNLFFNPEVMAFASDAENKSRNRNDDDDVAASASDEALELNDAEGAKEQTAEGGIEDDWLADLPKRGGGGSVIFSNGPTSFSISSTVAEFGFSAIRTTPVNDNPPSGPFNFNRSLDDMLDLPAAISNFGGSGGSASAGAGAVGTGQVRSSGDSFLFPAPGTPPSGPGAGGDGDAPGVFQPGDNVTTPPGGGNGGPGTDGHSPPTSSNRAPRVEGPVYLNGSFINQLLVIGAADLLVNASDPDGDPLLAQHLYASHGQIVANPDGSWKFTPDLDFTGEVVFGYQISDGTAYVVQEALLTINPIPGKEIIGTDADDLLLGTDGNDTITALEGDDIIHARGGVDQIQAGDGDDRIFAGDGNDIVFAGAGDDTVFGGAGDDTIFGEDGNDTIFAGAGNDVVFGGAGNDRIWGEDGNDILDGGEGDDELYGGTGDDLVEGGSGDDLLFGDEGDDVLIGGSDDDALYGGSDNDVFIATIDDGNDTHAGGEGVDTYDISRTDADAVIDLAAGTATSDDIGTDTLDGVENAIGGSGDDVIIANDDVNVMFGGAGADVFVFQTSFSAGLGRGSRDKIEDMEVGDRIDLKDISREFADLVEDALDDVGVRKFTLLDDEAEFSRPGQLKLKFDTLENGQEVTIIEGNIDHDAEAEFEIEIHGRHALTWIDFDGVQGG